ncbi:MAG: M20/M25/M40 family metallo-hydrolase [Desulfitobacteriaceae bacterium]
MRDNMNLIKTINNYVESEREGLINGLMDFLRLKSISAQNIGMQECAQALKATMQSLGIRTEMWQLEGGYPALFGEIINPQAQKTLLIYGHYDVQPPEPLDFWESDPFDPVLREGKIYARGATDDKGNLWATLMAVRCLKEIGIEIPINLKFFFEGEEEVGSPSMERYLTEHKDALKSDFTILCDRGIHESGKPQIYLGNKGNMAVELKIKGAKRDVHSSQAPLIPNPAWQLIWLLNQLKNSQEEVLIPGYYDDVLQPDDEDLELIARIPFDSDEYCKVYGIKETLPKGDKLNVLSKLLFQPTATINGLKSGYQGEGNKTIIPSSASVKLDFRLVKNQDPHKSTRLIKDFFKKRGPENLDIHIGNPRNPSKVSYRADIVQVAAQVAREVYQKDPVIWPLLDGSGPMSMFEEILAAPAIIIGLGAPFSLANTHAPNENIGVEDYLTGIKLMSAIYYRYGKRDEK